MLQNLELNTPIVDANGNPNEYFIRLLQGRGGILETTETLLAELLLKQILAGVGLDGGGVLGDPGDITIDLANTSVVPGTYTHATITVDAQGRLTFAASGSLTTDYYVSFGFNAGPDADELMFIHTFARAVTFPDEWLGAVGYCITNPTGSSYTLTVKKITGGVTSTVGSIVISTAGAFTFTTTGTTVAFGIGDSIAIYGAHTTNAALQGVGITFKGS